MSSEVSSKVSLSTGMVSLSKSEDEEAASNELLTEHFIDCVGSTCIDVPVPDNKLKLK